MAGQYKGKYLSTFSLYIILQGPPPCKEEYCSALVYVMTALSVRFLINLVRCSVVFLNSYMKKSCAHEFISLIRHDTGGISEGTRDGGQSKLFFLCVFNLEGQRIVFYLLFWSLSPTTWTMLFLLSLSHLSESVLHQIVWLSCWAWLFHDLASATVQWSSHYFYLDKINNWELRLKWRIYCSITKPNLIFNCFCNV